MSARPRQASYREAIRWIVENDDIEWLDNGDPESVTAVLVADLYRRSVEEVTADLRRAQFALIVERAKP